jgi:hypothetical protein
VVEKRLAAFSEKAMEYGTIVEETACQINELQGGIDKYETERSDSLVELKRKLNDAKTEAVYTANMINQRYRDLAQDPLVGRTGLIGGDADSVNDVVYSFDETGSDGAQIEGIWNSSCVDMRDVSWS